MQLVVKHMGKLSHVLMEWESKRIGNDEKLMFTMLFVHALTTGN